MRNLDFSSWQALFSTLFGLTVITLLMVGIRLFLMQRMQQRRERENRQINERLRTLIAAYRTLGGSFTGDLSVDPAHRRELRQRFERAEAVSGVGAGNGPDESEWPSSDRSRRIRDAVEAALSDIILLGTEQQVRLAARAATELAEGRTVHTAELVISLRDFIRRVLDLDPVPPDLPIPVQGPARPGSARGAGADKEGGKEGRQGGTKGLGGAAAGAGMGIGLGGDFGVQEDTDHHH